MRGSKQALIIFLANGGRVGWMILAIGSASNSELTASTANLPTSPTPGMATNRRPPAVLGCEIQSMSAPMQKGQRLGTQYNDWHHSSSSDANVRRVSAQPGSSTFRGVGDGGKARLSSGLHFIGAAAVAVPPHSRTSSFQRICAAVPATLHLLASHLTPSQLLQNRRLPLQLRYKQQLPFAMHLLQS